MRPRPRASRAGDLDVEADLPVRVRRISFDKWRAALGIARPAEHRRLAGNRPRRQADGQNQAEKPKGTTILKRSSDQN